MELFCAFLGAAGLTPKLPPYPPKKQIHSMAAARRRRDEDIRIRDAQGDIVETRVHGSTSAVLLEEIADWDASVCRERSPPVGLVNSIMPLVNQDTALHERIRSNLALAGELGAFRHSKVTPLPGQRFHLAFLRFERDRIALLDIEQIDYVERLTVLDHLFQHGDTTILVVIGVAATDFEFPCRIHPKDTRLEGVRGIAGSRVLGQHDHSGHSYQCNDDGQTHS